MKKKKSKKKKKKKKAKRPAMLLRKSQRSWRRSHRRSTRTCWPFGSKVLTSSEPFKAKARQRKQMTVRHELFSKGNVGSNARKRPLAQDDDSLAFLISEWGEDMKRPSGHDGYHCSEWLTANFLFPKAPCLRALHTSTS